MRNSEKKLINAVSAIVEEEGFSKLGINRIARKAGCDKVLIYRYFGGIDGLLTAWAQENDFYVFAYDQLGNELESAEAHQVKNLVRKVLLAQLHFLQGNILMQKLMLWELSGDSTFTALSQIREKNAYKLQEILESKIKISVSDSNMYIAFLVSAINYTVLRTIQYPDFNGIDFSQPESWKKFEQVIGFYVDKLFDAD